MAKLGCFGQRIGFACQADKIGRVMSMKTALDFPDDLLQEAMRVSRAKTKWAAVLAALGDVARRGRMRALADRLGDSTTFMNSAQLQSLWLRERHARR